MKKNIKLYLHHKHFEPVSYTKRTGIFGSIINLIIDFFYIVGLAVVSFVKIPVFLFKLLQSVPYQLTKVRSNIHNTAYQKRLALFSLIALIILTTVHGLIVVSQGEAIKGQVLGESTTAIQYLKDAQSSFTSNNPAAAKNDLSKALESFQKSQNILNSTNIALKSLLAVTPQKQDADQLLSAAELFTKAGINSAQILQISNQMKLSAAGLNSNNNKQNLEDIKQLLNQTVELATNAANKINTVSISALPKSYQGTFISVKDASNAFLTNVSVLKDASTLIFDLLLGQKNVLIVFENNNELRASGGFMGTIGNAKLNNGSLDSLDVRSVYDWDGQLKDKVTPPQPIYAVNDRWFLRDSNWFASFPDSSERIGSFFEREGGETPDLIIAMTPEVIIDWLKITGPIDLPQHHVTLTAENFVEKTQTETSVNYDKQQNQPKQFLADFFPLLMQKLGGQENGGLIAFLAAFQNNLQSKQILLYSRDQAIQQKILQFNWGGELRNTDRDYLHINSSNLGGTKTDRYLIRNISLNSSIDQNGEIIDTIKYEINNPLPNQDGLNNKSFIRFYVPEGSTLMGSEGFNSDIQLPRFSNSDFILDESVKKWQSGVSQDTISGTYTGKENGKTWFGNWMDIKGGETQTATLTYKLPFKLKPLDRLSVLLQKQPGAINEKFNYSLNAKNRRITWNSANLQTDNSIVNYSNDLNTDLFIGTVLEK